MQTGLPAPFPAAAVARRSPEHRQRHTQPSEPRAVPEGSGSPGRFLPAARRAPPPGPPAGEAGAAPPLPWRSGNPARGLRGAEGEPATCRRGGEGGRLGRPAREGGRRRRRSGSGEGTEPAAAVGGALLREGRNQGATGWGSPRGHGRARPPRALGDSVTACRSSCRGRCPWIGAGAAACLPALGGAVFVEPGPALLSRSSRRGASEEIKRSSS